MALIFTIKHLVTNDYFVPNIHSIAVNRYLVLACIQTVQIVLSVYQMIYINKICTFPATDIASLRFFLRHDPVTYSPKFFLFEIRIVEADKVKVVREQKKSIRI